MLKMRKGSAVPHPEKLYPSYQVMGKLFPDNPEETRQIISANIDDDQMEAAIRHFIKMHDEPLFFILEIPTKQQDEPNPNNMSHSDIYYIDSCNQIGALDILRRLGRSSSATVCANSASVATTPARRS